MNYEILADLREIIHESTEEVKKYDTGSPEYNAAVKTAIEFTKVYTELDDKEKARSRENEEDVVRAHEAEAKYRQQQIDTIVKIGTESLKMVGKVAGTIVIVGLTAYGIAWEKNDRISSDIFRTTLKDLLRLKL